MDGHVATPSEIMTVVDEKSVNNLRLHRAYHTTTTNNNKGRRPSLVFSIIDISHSSLTTRLKREKNINRPSGLWKFEAKKMKWKEEIFPWKLIESSDAI